MNNLISILLLCTACATASANGAPGPGPANTNANTNQNNNTTVLDSVAQGGAANVAANGGSVGAVTGGASSVGNTASNSTSTNNNNITSVENYEAQKIPVSTVYGGSLTSGQDTCLGSTTGGVQTQILGISLGSTVRDRNCEMIKQVQLLNQMGLSSAACHRARAGEEGREINAAMIAAGVDCNQLVAAPARVSAAEVEDDTPPVIIKNELPDMSKFVTREELQERDARIFRFFK